MDKPQNLYETSWMLYAARVVLMNLHDCGTLVLDTCKGKERKVYNEAAFQMLMMDDIALQCWLAIPIVRWMYYDHEKDKKGRLTKCKARML